MTTWDEIKTKTEKRATKLWADDDDEYSDEISQNNTNDSDNSDSPSTSTASVCEVDQDLDTNTIKHTITTESIVASASDCKKSFVDAVLGPEKKLASKISRTHDPTCSKPGLGHSDGSNAKIRTSVGVPGDPIGIKSIQSIMMSATQMNLSHFHTAGMSSGYILGGAIAPSAAEAMNSIYTKNNTSMKFKMHYSDTLESSNSEFELLRYVRKNLVGASFGHFVRKIGSNITELPERENIWYTTLKKPSDSDSEVQVPGVLLRIYIDYNKMHNHGLTLENLAQKIFGSDCSWNVSPDFMGMIDISVPDTYISQWLSRLKNRVCGTSDVLSCRNTSCLFPSTFFTRGTNVLAACKVPGIDKSTIELNNVISVEKNFGIEAAANILADLTGNVIVSDFMARTGRILPFSKHSSEVSNKGLLTSMGFERPKDDIQREINTRKHYSPNLHLRDVKSYTRCSFPSVYEHIITGNDPPLGFRIVTSRQS